MKGSCIFFHDFRMVQLSLANELPPAAREAGLHSFCAILWKYNLQFFLKQNTERVLRWEKLKLYLSKMARSSMRSLKFLSSEKLGFVLNFNLVQYLSLFELFIFC